MRPSGTGQPHLSLVITSKSVPFQGTLTQQLNSLGLWLPPPDGWPWGWDWDCVQKPYHWVCQELFFETTALLICHSRLCPLRGHGTLLPDGSLFQPLHHIKESLPPLSSFSHVSSALYIPFPLYHEAGRGEWLAQSLPDVKTNTILIRC